MKIITYLNFDGNCKEAFEYYASILGGKVESLFLYGESPIADQVPSEMATRVMHATLTVGDQKIMGCDCIPGKFTKPACFAVSLNLSDEAKAETIFSGFANDGAIEMPLQKTFWAKLFGMLDDRYGISWMINCE